MGSASSFCLLTTSADLRRPVKSRASFFLWIAFSPALTLNCQLLTAFVTHPASARVEACPERSRRVTTSPSADSKALSFPSSIRNRPNMRVPSPASRFCFSFFDRSCEQLEYISGWSGWDLRWIACRCGVFLVPFRPHQMGVPSLRSLSFCCRPEALVAARRRPCHLDESGKRFLATIATKPKKLAIDVDTRAISTLLSRWK
jgi:hypothetical protein